ncbi:MAG: HAD family hydrolase, partial [Candidatus Omnitrophica bacterium]|nr:HAD family hydrolase [Candidatus Omnitrophota bacterium]
VIAQGVDISGVATDILINVNPFLEGHILIVPERAMNHRQYFIPQVASVGLGILRMVGLRSYKVAFNSIGAFASINHLHLQALDYGRERIPVENAARSILFKRRGVTVEALADWMVRTVLLSSDDEIMLGRELLAFASVLHAEEQPFNIIFTYAAPRYYAYVFPRKFQGPSKFGTGVAYLELGGEVLFVKQEDKGMGESLKVYEEAMESALADEIARVGISDREFDSIIKKFKSSASPIEQPVGALVKTSSLQAVLFDCDNTLLHPGTGWQILWSSFYWWIAGASRHSAFSWQWNGLVGDAEAAQFQREHFEEGASMIQSMNLLIAHAQEKRTVAWQETLNFLRAQTLTPSQHEWERIVPLAQLPDGLARQLVALGIEFVRGHNLLADFVVEGADRSLAVAGRERTYVLSACESELLSQRITRRFPGRVRFDHIFGTDIYTQGWGDKRDIIARLLKQNKWNPQRVVMIGDGLFDIRAAADNGISAIGLTSDSRLAQKMQDVLPSVTIAKNLREAIEGTLLSTASEPSLGEGASSPAISTPDDLSPRERTSKEIAVLERIHDLNARARRYLYSHEVEEFVIVDLEFADFILNNMPSEHKELAQEERLYQEIVDLTVMARQALIGEQIPFAIHNPTGEVTHTEIITVNRKAPGVEKQVSTFVTEGLGAEIGSILSCAEPFTIDEPPVQIEFLLHEVGRYDLQSRERQLTKREINKSIPLLPPFFIFFDISAVHRSQNRLLAIIETRFQKQREITEITPALRGAIQQQGITTIGVPYPQRITTMGIIFKYDSSGGIAYPLKYRITDVEGELEALRKVYEEVAVGLAEEEPRAANYLRQAWQITQRACPETKFVPFSYFASEIIVVLKELHRDEENRSLEATIQSACRKISDTIYPFMMPSEIDMVPHSNKEEALINVFRVVQEAHEAAIAEAEESGDDERMLVEMPFVDTAKSMVKSALLALRQYQCSSHEAIFRAAQPLVCQGVAAELTPMVRMFTDIPPGVARRAMKLLESSERIILKGAPEKNPFILLLHTDIDGNEEFRQLRRDYPNMVGMVVRSGAKHYVIIARQHNFPVLTDVYTVFEGMRLSTWEALQTGDIGIIDTLDEKGIGTLRVNPTVAEMKASREAVLYGQAEEQYVESRLGEPVVTLDGIGVPVQVILDSSEDARRISELAVEGIGLFRTEDVYMERKRLITEEEWCTLFEGIVTQSKVKSIYVRLVDRKVTGEGEDLKDSDSFGDSQYEGADFLLIDPIGRDQIALVQVRAAMRVFMKYGALAVMFPMISTLEQWRKAIDLFEEAEAGLLAERKITEEFLKGFKRGLMYETPSAVSIRQSLMRNSDFGSIGTNDLIAYTLGLDRGSKGTTEHLIQLSEVTMLQLEELAAGAQINFMPLSLCGMLASVPGFLLYAAYLAAQGKLIQPTVGIAQVAWVKEFIRHINIGELGKIFEGKRDAENTIRFVEELEEAVAVVLGRLENAVRPTFTNLLFSSMPVFISPGTKALPSASSPIAVSSGNGKESLLSELVQE